jgi:hypothetical protein
MAQQVEESSAMKFATVLLVTSTLALNSTALLACPQCRPTVASGVYNREFAANLSVLLLPIAVLFVVGIAIHFSDAIVTTLREAATLRKSKGAQQ